MNKLTIVSLLLLGTGIMCFSPVDARTPHRKTAAKAKNTSVRKKPAAMRIKTVVDRIENGDLSSEKTFDKTLSKVKKFYSSTMEPYIAAKYPAKTSLSLSGKAKLLYQDVDKYVYDTPEYSMYTFSMGTGMADRAWANSAISYAVMIEIEEQLPDEASKKAWWEYCSRLTELTSLLSNLASSNAVCQIGAGTFIITEAPAIANQLQTSLQSLLEEDMRGLKGQKINSNPTLLSRSLMGIMKMTEESSYDADIYASIPDTEKDDMKKERKQLTELIPVCQEAYQKWVETLPENIRPLMADNLGILLTAPIWNVE